MLNIMKSSSQSDLYKNKSTRIITATFGILLAIAGFEHGMNLVMLINDHRKKKRRKIRACSPPIHRIKSNMVDVLTSTGFGIQNSGDHNIRCAICSTQAQKQKFCGHSLVMPKGVFHKSVAYLGIATFAAAIIALALFPIIGLTYFWWWAVFAIWFIAVGWKLYRLGRT